MYTFLMFALFPSRAVAVQIFSLSIHWYGLLYVAAFLLASVLLPRLQHLRNVRCSRDDWSHILTAGILGVLIGGRMGYVLFYHPLYFAAHPLEIFAVWKGGMSSHGGFLGVGIALALVARKVKVPLFTLLDLVVVPVAIGLALGRIGNFINQELYGTVTSLPWGIAVSGVDGMRHPVQFYAAAKDLLIAGISFLHLRHTRHLRQPGRTLALFLILYGILRFLLEYVREPDAPLAVIGSVALTRGQLYTLPLFAIVAVLLAIRRSRILRGS